MSELPQRFITEQEMVEAEACIPLAAAAAFASASKRVLESGDSVLLAEDDVLYEVFPDGMRKRIKPIQASVVVKAGERIRIVNHQTDPSGRNSR